MNGCFGRADSFLRDLWAGSLLPHALPDVLHRLSFAADHRGAAWLGLAATIANAVANILLDWVFVAVLGWGMEGPRRPQDLHGFSVR